MKTGIFTLANAAKPGPSHSGRNRLEHDTTCQKQRHGFLTFQTS
jgi:hypothetical protein